MLLLPAAGALWGEPGAVRWRRLLVPALVLAGVVLAVNLPFAVLSPESWAWFFRFNAGRGAENSAWHALGISRGTALELLSAGPLLAASAFALWAAARVVRRQGEAGRAVRLGAALALTLWIATNKVWSPQYALYGFLAGAVAAAPTSLFLALSAMSVADFHLAFEVRARRWEPWFRDHLVDPGSVIRTLLWLALAAWISRALWRAARAQAGPDGISSPSTR